MPSSQARATPSVSSPDSDATIATTTAQKSAVVSSSSSGTSESSNTNNPSSWWSLSIKPVGSEHATPPTPPSSTSSSTITTTSTTASTNSSGSTSNTWSGTDFTIQVSPDESLSALYERIQGVTGLTAHQQRLIYRGQLIGGGSNSNSNNPTTPSSAASPSNSNTTVNKLEESSSSTSKSSSLKIKDIRGLCDGQTIHLVKKREAASSSSSSSSQPPSPSSSSSSNSTSSPPTTNERSRPRRGGGGGSSETMSDDDEEGDSVEVLGGGGASSAAPLLAALLGLGNVVSASDYNNNDNTTTVRGGGRWRSTSTTSRIGTSRRRMNHRLTVEDLDIPDPGSLESVRQGMMTLHTLLPHAQVLHSNNNSNAVVNSTTASSPIPSSSPLVAEQDRQWYIGQWIDCLDTVNQWLEATIIDIAVPSDLLPMSLFPCSGTATSQRSSDQDPIVTASDLEGRQKLLLVRCESDNNSDEDESHENIDNDELAGWRGYQRRDPIDSPIQLLLVHYNGWPHRWDEWIRSDSPRLRPFRVRTRHPNNSLYASPTPQSHYAESPSTMIRSHRNAANGDDNDESHDRHALLPELNRVMTSIQQLVQATSEHVLLREQQHQQQLGPPNRDEEDHVSSDHRTQHLPWIAPPPPPVTATTTTTASSSSSSTADTITATPVGPSNDVLMLRRELDVLAPLLDRLGRVLIDAAPHVAALSRTIPTSPHASTENDHNNHTVRDEQEDEPHDHHSPTSLGGLLSLLGRDRRRQSNASTNIVVPHDDPPSVQDESVQTGVSGNSSSGENASVTEANNVPIDPDFTDFAYGVVNTTRGEVRRGPRTRTATSSSSPSDEAAGLLGAYLAAASLGSLTSADDGEDGTAGNLQGLGRLLRERGTGGGIDIHIHAVVTAPGSMPSGGLGLTAIGGGGVTTGGGGGTLMTAASTSEPVPTLFSARNLVRPGHGRHSTRTAQPTVPEDDDEDGIFSELYSENPEPIDLSRPTSSASNLGLHPSTRDRRSETSSIPRSPLRGTSLSSPTSTSSVSSGARSNQHNAPERSPSRRGGVGSGSGFLGRLFRRNTTNDGE